MRQSVDPALSTPGSVTDSSGGANQIGVRAYNERLVMSLVRRHGSLSKAEISRLCGLSAQTVSVIMRSLEKDGLLVRGERLRGKVGQPSTPMRLNPDAVFSFGVKIGRRSVDLVLMDFVGRIKLKLHRTYPYPMPEWIMPFVIEGIAEIESKLTDAEREKIAGVGIAAPFELWNWAQEVGAPQIEMERWRSVDIRADIAESISYPVFLQNDATSACGAELVFGAGQNCPDFLYIFIGSFIGGGVVLNSALFSGRTGTAGAIGPLPVQGQDGKPVQLLKIASIFVLENMLREEGIDPRPLWFSPDEWIDFGEPLEQWIRNTAAALAQAVIAAASIIDFSSVIIDGGFPDWVRKRIVVATQLALGLHDLQGVMIPEIIEGEVGSQARAVGGASLPLFSRYLIDQNVLFKDPGG
ncbi:MULTISPECIES: ROK family transcriptional regulator [Rhizobium/Agrobacterium group]|uniref:ROK family transcriptional regulator n=1 Tax=Rhizobium/Agrobacterium group TaxID=227290 RepID=UPI00110D5185|nr:MULTISPECIES: ROK family transcriptional regulator [Rhizobium/Agrobacterium group]NWJ24392.1 ROK family transcriptional regulator [Rhizobium sp. RM]TMV16215.1 ROK family transcriptional regulator [Rhizobium sp. Td3]UXS02738.1 ROK family transcriptional regulator [Agrobacterium tumefaciens]